MDAILRGTASSLDLASRLEAAVAALRNKDPFLPIHVLVRTPIRGTWLGRTILLLRGRRVMLDADLAALYEVSVKRLNEQVGRNRDRFPEDFMFQLSEEEHANLKSQFATSSSWGGGGPLPTPLPNKA